MSHSRKYTVALIGSDSRLRRVAAMQLTLAEAAAWLDSHQRAPSPGEQPCILLQVPAPAMDAVASPPRRAC